MKKVISSTWSTENNLAANSLADILTSIGDAKLAKTVDVHFHRYFRRLRALSVVNRDNREYFMTLLLHQTIKESEKINNTIVKTLMLNVMCSKFRIELKKLRSDL